MRLADGCEASVDEGLVTLLTPELIMLTRMLNVLCIVAASLNKREHVGFPQGQ